MKIERSSSKSGLFLIELIIAIVFFAVSSAICTQLFVKAHVISTRSNDLNIAAQIAQSYAENFKLSPAGQPETLFYGADGALTQQEQAVYSLRTSLADNAAPASRAEVSVYKISGVSASEDSPLLLLEVASYGGMNS